ncbi:10735_t:CDS:10 [Diversispora eburnea]|uniref:10735_t:CDS:1 n=1 Tax=Diversispora eburnea TaxID=1213867 RepID=A0A9N8WFW1_9GLOM|nr:10735_t:CDS:10 [Diversispora eburnea]
MIFHKTHLFQRILLIPFVTVSETSFSRLLNYKLKYVKNVRHYKTNNSQSQDTIFALSTAQGKAGIAIIRISGPNASQAVKEMVLKQSLKKKFPIPRKATGRFIVHPITGEMLDHGLVLWFPDIAEFHIHGGTSVVRGVLDALGSIEGFRHAECGEFTHRAFDNDKLDLTEVEGIADLLNAETEAQRRLALRQAQGGLKHLYDTWRQQLIENMALVEAVIDFGEDENIEDEVLNQVNERIKHLVSIIQNHMNDNRRGEILRDGIHVTIMGPPNVGKSSFLNYLAQRQAAIVSPIPGTTRDVIEISLNIGGYPIIIGDTAGLRKSDDIIEMEGIIRAKNLILSAEIKICILSSVDIFNSKNNSLFNLDPMTYNAMDKNTILILNKTDLLNKTELSYLKEIFTEVVPTNYIFCLSCVTGEGIKEFLEFFVTSLRHKYDDSTSQVALITQARHREHLNECLKGLRNFLGRLQNDLVLAAEELRHATNALGKITGRVSVDEILNNISKDFTNEFQQ